MMRACVHVWSFWLFWLCWPPLWAFCCVQEEAMFIKKECISWSGAINTYPPFHHILVSLVLSMLSALPLPCFFLYHRRT